MVKAPRSGDMTIPISPSKGSREPPMQHPFQRPPFLDLLRQDHLDASVTGGSDIPIVQRAACPRSSRGRPLPSRCPSLAPNHPSGSLVTTRRPPPESVSLGLEDGRGREYVSNGMAWSMAGAARPLGLFPFGYNATARRAGALRAFADHLALGSLVLGPQRVT
jgi:hypothetical protein